MRVELEFRKSLEQSASRHTLEVHHGIRKLSLVTETEHEMNMVNYGFALEQLDALLARYLSQQSACFIENVTLQKLLPVFRSKPNMEVRHATILDEQAVP